MSNELSMIIDKEYSSKISLKYLNDNLFSGELHSIQTPSFRHSLILRESS